MFGYIKPLKPELRVREYEYYRAAYCGLCNSLRQRYGFLSRFIVNYDFTLISLMLAYADNCETEIKKKRCIVCPAGRNCMLSPSCDRAADISVILFYLKLADDVSDKGFFEGLFRARIPKMLLSGAYKKAAKREAAYAERAKVLFAELALLEAARIPSVDETADKFANMLVSILEGEGKVSRILSQLFYHIGRFVYIIDALDDLAEDAKRDEYNPIAERFGVFDGKLPEDILDEVITTLRHSINAVKTAFDLLDENENSGLLKNIIELGMENSIHVVTKKEK